MKSQLSILQESLTAKRQVLLEIQEYNRKQEEVFSSEEVDMSLFDEAIEEKGRLIERLTQLDDGFEAMYQKLARELENNREKYAEQIRMLQQQIKEITDLGVSIQAQEARNKALIESYFSRERKNMHKSLQNSTKAYNFYKNMSGLNAASNQSSYDSKQ
ncbi:MAG: flagellar protein FliT [bacterium]|nr:flagellar protein FliT [bacterium]MCM1376084.1 hypothetical protein [Muribaculum sp.]